MSKRPSPLPIDIPHKRTIFKSIIIKESQAIQRPVQSGTGQYIDVLYTIVG